MPSHLHGDLSVVDKHLSRQEVGADRGLVAGAELLVDLHMRDAFVSRMQGGCGSLQ